MKKLVILQVSAAFIVLSVVNGFTQNIVWRNISRENLNLNAVLINQNNPKVIYIGSNNAVQKTEDAGESWRNVLSIKGQNKTVNFLSFDYKNRNCLYAGTGNGLFYSSNQGKTWQRIFKGSNYLESDCSAGLVCGQTLFLGTKKGLFISQDNGRSWSHPTGKLANSRILAIVSAADEAKCIYAASENGVFMTKDNGQLWQRIFFANSAQTDTITGIEEGSEEPNNAEEENKRLNAVRNIVTGKNNPNQLYLAASKGIYKSLDSGENWNLLPDYGLLDNNIKFLAISLDSTLYAVSKSGVFKYENERWQELSLGLVAQEINALDFDKQGNLYAASDKGIFIAETKVYSTNAKINEIALYSKNEPSIQDIQKAAVSYAEVAPEKIANWRKQAQKKAFLPKVGTGINRETTDLWHWETGSTTKTGDDALNKGKGSLEWDITLSWDLGEIIWNSDQTAIDARSRLMVELRDDILNEVTKLYFERIRIKMELNNLPIEDRKKRFEKELKLQELTSLLDALTGGCFSQQDG